MASGRTARKSHRTSEQRFDSPSPAEPVVTRPWGILFADLLIAALLLILPFVMGGREAWGHRLLITLSITLGFVWCFHKVFAGGRLLLLSLEPLMIAGILLVWFQTVPQPQVTLNQISPEYQRLLSDWGTSQIIRRTADHESRPEWKTVSLTPAETRHGLMMMVSYVLVAVVVAQRLQSAADCHRILKVVGCSGILMAVFGVCQLALSNDRFFWFYRHPYTGTGEVLKGAFTNRNHFAQFLVLSIGPLIWWLIDEYRGHRAGADNVIRKGLGPAQGNHSNFDRILNLKLLLLLCGVVGVVLCVVLTLSRGGMLAAGAACAVTLLGLWKVSEIRSSLALLMVAGGVALVGGAFLAGQDGVELRVNQLASGDADQIDQTRGRRTIWKADADAVRAFPLLGTGVGSHREIYPIYMEELGDFATYEFSHAESSYLNLALETGLTGLGLLVLGLIFVCWRIGRGMLVADNAELSGCLTAIAASIAGGMLHAVADFIWYVPAIVVTTTVLMVAGLRLRSKFAADQGLPIPRIGWLCGAVACAALVLSVQPELHQRVLGERYWHQFLITTFDQRDGSSDDDQDHMDAAEIPENEVDAIAATEVESEETTDSSSTSSDYRHRAADPREEESRQSLQHRMGLLLRSLRANPHQPRVQLLLSSVSLKLFEHLQEHGDNPLNLLQIRDTVNFSEFQSVEEMRAWMHKAFGNSVRLIQVADQLARNSLKGCPVQGNAYLTLAETGFLRGLQRADQDLLVEQAVLLRGHDPRVRYVAGQEALAKGNQTEAIRHWEAVFHANAMYRRAITRILAGVIPASFLLDQFQPSAPELIDVLHTYTSLNRPAADIQQIVAAAEIAAEQQDARITPDVRIALLVRTADAAVALGMTERAETLLRKAAACDETAYWPRRALGNLLYRNQQFAEAAEVFRWCYEQDPGDERLESLIRDARRKSLPVTAAKPLPARNASFERPAP
jgi:O-antigen ligase/tetratricopeptide (TPR) repeat protein